MGNSGIIPSALFLTMPVFPGIVRTDEAPMKVYLCLGVPLAAIFSKNGMILDCTLSKS